MKDTKEVMEFIERRRAALLTDIKGDEARTNDPIIGNHMKGRLAVEQHYLQTLEDLMEIIKE